MLGVVSVEYLEGFTRAAFWTMFRGGRDLFNVHFAHAAADSGGFRGQCGTPSSGSVVGLRARNREQFFCFFEGVNL